QRPRKIADFHSAGGSVQRAKRDAVSRFEALQADEEPAGDHEPAIAPLDADPLPRGVPDDLDERHHGCASGSPYEAAVVPVDGAEAIADAVGSRFTHAAVVHTAL